MYSTNKIIRTISLIGACVFVTLSLTARAVDPPPDGGYPGFNTAEGQDALFNLTTGLANTANGYQALHNNTTGNGNTANGEVALFSNTTGFENTALGERALYNNTTGWQNTANGASALEFNTTGGGNTATGLSALTSNTGGSANTATGVVALGFNTTGSYNTATGYYALGNTTGSNNTANGAYALGYTTGSDNTANGVSALLSNGTGHSNTATGVNALFHNTTGDNNTADGVNALFHNSKGHNNTAAGYRALDNNSTGSANIALGTNAGRNLTTGDANIDIGNSGVAGEANTIRIGRLETQSATYVAGVSGAIVAGGVGVIIDTNGHLGTVTSSERFKHAIKPMDKASEAILALQPVTFRYKHELDPDGIPQFGLVAEQVAKVNPDLVARDDEGKPYTVRYEAVNAMLLNEFLKEHRKVEEQAHMNQEQEVMIVRQEKDIAALKAALEAQAAQIQKVSDQLRTRASAPRVAANN